MGSFDQDEAPDMDQDLVQSSYLTYIVPFATNFQLEQALLGGEGSTNIQSLFAAVEQREWLFFDETVDVYLVLRIPRIGDERVLRSYLARLVISLEAQISNTSTTSERDNPPASEIIYNGSVQDPEDPLITISEAEDAVSKEGEAPETYTFAVWKLPVFLLRPRIRLQAPFVMFAATASLKPADTTESSSLKRGYLQSRVPSGLNLLDSFANDAALGGVKPRLSALRVSRVAPAAGLRDHLVPLKGLQNIKKKIFPAVHTRVRFSRPNTTPPSPVLVALLEVDFTPFFDCEATLSKVTMSVTDGIVDDLNSLAGMGPPLQCVAHDHVTYIYRLAPQQMEVATKNPNRDLDIGIEIVIFVRPDGPDACTPLLKMAWTTTLDFTVPLNPGFGQPIIHSLQRSHRPSQLSIGGGSDAQSLIAPSVSRPDSLPGLEAAAIAGTTDTTIPEFGITMTFSGPKHPVHAGEEFQWTIFVVNRSKPETAPPPGTGSGVAGAGGSGAPSTGATTGARKLALLVIPKKRRNELRVLRPPSTSGGTGGARRDPLVADAVLDENVVHAMQRSSLVDSTDVVCLSPDVRVGPLAPDACAVVELRFLAMHEGLVGIEAVRVVDLGSQEHVDVRELPVMVVEPRRGDENIENGDAGPGRRPLALVGGGNQFQEIAV